MDDRETKIIILRKMRNEMLKRSADKLPKKEKKQEEEEGPPNIIMRLMQLEGQK